MTTETLLWLIPLPPVLAFFLIVIFTNKNRALSHTIGVGAAPGFGWKQITGIIAGVVLAAVGASRLRPANRG